MIKIVEKLHSFLFKILINFYSIFGDSIKISLLRRILLKFARIKGEGNVFIDYGFDFYNSKNITIKKNVSIGHYNRIWAFDKVSIGNYVQTAIGLTIVAGSHENDTFASKRNQQVIVSDGCWIGANVTILGGVTIGKGSIIGTGSIVTKDIPDFSIAAGVPAKIISKRHPAQKVLNPFGWYDISELD
jgi:acetyltransferase-like isoleucine patch superfamily enzyme